ncbi:prepilin-type N-terminal cleavage/methylation domain-containing protein [Archangium minus]|uniref:Prepilin-type N-terminal cleavage/methylation domain-containing protein n=1 Tax=Archangium minus TaxID=83450 RepID=A0ABY9X675_9BACT|nr:prepilin-type N-terminal cleavage/methylation domain-containing protein [Archangium violaceum]WNG50891.1 prepilin-type N-terminal cleavage/methylation domain-containing protein [Archangium minus]
MSPTPHARSRLRGFSLIESMAALVVFTIGILGVLQMNVLASQQNGLARRQSTASKIARDMVDAFERLPFEHALLSTESTIDPGDPRFARFDEADGRVMLADAVALVGERPLLGAAHASVSTESAYEVAWRVAPLKNDEGTTEARRILVMVRFPTTAGSLKQVNVWAVKFNPQAIGRGAAAIPEI